MNDDKKNNDYPIVERRKFPRVRNFIDIYYTVSFNEEKTIFKNIGLEGICLVAHIPIKKGSILDLRFKLLKDEPEVRIKGKVIWNKKFDRASYDTINYEIGIQFIEISESDKKNIAKIYLAT
ncbi:MAG: PilZ domain-containing protein [Candidatus Omnitrophica bacterium]|nr:PilZ domain-containing protein [Candidatus Omnitrophota bacterium]MCK5288453.1 PilZ domain-containing protein [Candidatus Omnitrophota bacterium]